MVRLRKANYADMDVLYEWANDSVVRNNSFCSKPISYETHKVWFNRIMSDPMTHQYILMDNSMAVGQIRLCVTGEEAEISYSIAKEFRGQGYGRILLRLTVEEVRTNHSEIVKLIAKVKPDNISSNKLFCSEGYSIDYCCYSLNTLIAKGEE